MKIAGKTPNFFKRQEIILQDEKGEAFTFSLTPPPMDFYDRLEKQIPPPLPPKNFAKDDKGKLQKDENGRAVVIRNEDDPGYREKMRDAQQLQSVALVYEILKDDKNIEFETKKETFGAVIDFYRALRIELQKTIPISVFLKLVETAGQMLRVSDEIIKETEQNFLETNATPSNT